MYKAIILHIENNNKSQKEGEMNFAFGAGKVLH